MKAALPCFAILIAAIAISSAAPPREKPLAHYKELWEDSLITNKPEPDKPPQPEPNPLDDYTLASVCQLGDGWHIVLLHRKNRDERVPLKSGMPNPHGFRIVTVDNPTSRQEATVEIQSGTHSATLHFEAEYLTQLRKAAPSSPNGRLQVKNQNTNNRIRQVPVPQPKNVRRIPVPANQ